MWKDSDDVIGSSRERYACFVFGVIVVESLSEVYIFAIKQDLQARFPSVMLLPGLAV
jgi:hypothetical protein